MKSTELIGKVVCEYLRNRATESDDSGTARYILDCFSKEQLVEIARAVTDDSIISETIEIKLPGHYVGDCDLPPDILTSERTTYFRNCACPKPILLVANTGDDEEQSLKELFPIGSNQLCSEPHIWVKIASQGLPITDEHGKWWSQALKGLLEARAISLERFADYISATREAISQGGHPILSALAHSLPALRVPRDTTYFNSLTNKNAGHVSKWKNLYSTAFKKRACYLIKQNPTQNLLTEDILQASFDRVKDTIPLELHEIIKRFSLAQPGWNTEANELSECEWEMIRPLFDGLRREQFNLGDGTIDFYSEREPELMSADERDYLDRLSTRKALDPDDEDEEFYKNHRHELKESPLLKSRWDKFIFGAPVETDDFLIGLTECLQSLFDQDQQSTQRKLTVTCDRRTPKDLRELNCDAGLYFSFRYRGIKELIGKGCKWAVGKLFEFPDLDMDWRKASKPHVNRSTSRNALQLKFYLELEVLDSKNTVNTYTKQLIWKFYPSAITSECYSDWGRIAEHPLLQCRAIRELVGTKGKYQSIDLRDVRTLLPTFDKDRGSLIPVYKKEDDVEHYWIMNLKRSLEQRMIQQSTYDNLVVLFQKFVASYKKAVAGFLDEGLFCSALLEQVKDYGNLLEVICLHAKGDKNRDLLLKPIVDIGAAQIEGGVVTTIIAPWHPLRLAAIACKANYISELIRHLLVAENVLFGDTKLYFEELTSELKHPFYPEIALGWNQTQPELLGLTDHYLGYSLHEVPVSRIDNHCDTNENPTESSLRIVELIQRFLALHPHEKANLSIVLYNCDSARLPQAVVDSLNDVHEDQEDMHCQVILRHRNGAKLRNLYEKIVESTDIDADSFVASEASRDFMARLRIGIMADQAPPPDSTDGPPTDIVFLQDVIARHARVEWYQEDASPIPFEQWIPPRWSRRRPAAVDDMKSVVYLCCPVAAKEGWDFLTAVTTFIRGDWDGNKERRLLPARQLDFNDPTTSSIFKETHNLGNWVVNYDELLDRRQLLNQCVKVIRYKQSETQGRNILISSTAPLGLLRSMVLQRVKDLNLNLAEEDYKKLTERLINDANEISGDLVLRAAKRGRNASELIGVVLSRYLIRKEFSEPERYFGWYFLDDYANWLGQREEQIADILCLSPELDSKGRKRLAVVISESKYIDAASLSVKRKESQKQLRQTMDRIEKALFGDPGRLDRDIWLSRFSDMVLSGIQFPANADLRLSEWRRAIREGNCDIYLRGYSHVFISGPSDSSECSEVVEVADCADSYQEVFSRAKLRELLLHYWKQTDPIILRKEISGDDKLQDKEYRKPTNLISSTDQRKTAKAKEKPVDVKSIPDQPAVANNATPVESNPVLPLPKEASPTASKDTHPIAPWACSGVEEVLRNTQAQTPEKDEGSWLTQTANSAKGALQQFQLNSKLLSSSLTPNAALLKFQGSANLTVDHVLKRRSEFLTTHKLNLVSVRAEPGVVSLSVARPNRRILTLHDLWKRWTPDCSKGNQELLIGEREENGSLLCLSPIKNAPHTLVAGTTGSGKSVLMQNILLSIAATNTPEQAKIILIDPKMGVDYFGFEGLPHLRNDIITSPEVSLQVLNELVAEMNRRYEVLRKNKVANIIELRSKQNATEYPEIIWVVHDEFAEWMMTDEYKDGVSNIVSRLGVKARAAGIFLVFGAQRPDANVMPMQLRANLGNRLVLKVDGEGTSEIALGEKGAERLLGKGHLAAKIEGEDSIITAQVPLVTSVQIEEIVSAIRQEYGTSK